MFSYPQHRVDAVLLSLNESDAWLMVPELNAICRDGAAGGAGAAGSASCTADISDSATAAAARPRAGKLAMSTPPITMTAPIRSATLGTCPSVAHAAVMPVTGTSIENGATRLEGLRFISVAQMPLPTTVPSSTV